MVALIAGGAMGCTGGGRGGTADAIGVDTSLPEHCTSGATDGDETDVDCGGSCGGCAKGQLCRADDDCFVSVCGDGGRCVVSSCSDGQQGPGETGVDCGGSCPLCDGASCGGDGQCATGNCVGGQCATPTCSDGKKNGGEGGIDCGGGVCPQCAEGQLCGGDGDCISGWCKDGYCAAPSCSDGLKNENESDVDCGGTCDPCGVGKTCGGAGDCETGLCAEDGTCQVPAATCTDGQKNDDESDVDCGGDTCGACPVDKTCGRPSDCLSETCIFGTCRTPTCDDGVQNQGESDQDCGGDACDPCADGEACDGPGDCASGSCTGGVCVSCSDHVQNQGESDVDCGGAQCGACGNGKSCGGPDDCVSGRCDAGVCASCSDGVQSGDEAGVDCGPVCGALCRVDEQLAGPFQAAAFHHPLSIALDGAGRPVVVWAEGANDDIESATLTADGTWQHAVLEGMAAVHAFSPTVSRGSGGVMHVAWATSHKAALATGGGTTWTVEDVGGHDDNYVAIVHDALGEPRVLACGLGDCGFFHRGASGWESETFDPPAGTTTSIYPASPHVFLRDGGYHIGVDWGDTDNGYRYYTGTPGSWQNECLGGSCASQPSVVGDIDMEERPGGGACFAYTAGATTDHLMLDCRTASGWTSETLDAGYYPRQSLAFRANGDPVVVAQRFPLSGGIDQDVYLFTREGQGWHKWTISESHGAIFPQLVIDGDDAAQIVWLEKASSPGGSVYTLQRAIVTLP